MERAEAIRLRFNQLVFEHGVDAAAPGTFGERLAEFGKLLGLARGDNFNMAVFGISDPTMESESGGLAMDEPAESNALDAAFD